MVRWEGNMSLKIPVTPLGIDLGTVRLVAQRLNHYATPGPIFRMYNVTIFFTIHIGHPPGFCITLDHVLLVSETKH